MKRIIVVAIAMALGIFGMYDVSEACCGAYDPPTIDELTCTPEELWPPNHKYVDVMVQAQISGDPEFVSPDNWRVLSVVSDQPDNSEGLGDGDTINDCYVEGTVTDPSGLRFGMCKIRAERCGVTAEAVDRGRTYTIVVEAWAAGPEQTLYTQRSCEVYVPHDKGK